MGACINGIAGKKSFALLAPLPAQLNFEEQRSLPRLPNGIFLSHSIGVKPVCFLFNWGVFIRGLPNLSS